MKLRKGKLLGFIILTLFLGFIFKLDVNAASASVSVTSNKSSLVVGNTVTFTVRVQANSAIGAWDYATNVSSNLTYISGSPVSKSANLPSNDSTKVITYSFTYRANSSGTATFNFRLSNLLDYKTESLMSFPANTSRSVKVITQNELEQSYSKNNNLKSLSIEGYQLSPTFNKNTLEYNVEVPNYVTKVKINATKEDSTASIQGTGEREVSEGKNKLEIKVTAQNGSVKTYVINVTVKELDPIKVKVDNEEFNVVRKESQITAPNTTFTKTTIKINDLEVPAFENKKLGYILIGLKNEDGDIALYIYDEKENAYTPYLEYNFKASIICIIDDIDKIYGLVLDKNKNLDKFKYNFVFYALQMLDAVTKADISKNTEAMFFRDIEKMKAGIIDTIQKNCTDENGNLDIIKAKNMLLDWIDYVHDYKYQLNNDIEIQSYNIKTKTNSTVKLGDIIGLKSEFTDFYDSDIYRLYCLLK